MKKVLVLVALLACDTPTKPAPVKWGPPLTAAQCIALCAPLAVESFRPSCSRKIDGDRWYYCGQELTNAKDVCSCGNVIHQASQNTADTPNLVAPVVVHHGLKYILGH